MSLNDHWVTMLQGISITTIYANILQARFNDYAFNYNESKLVDLRTARTVSVIPNAIDWQPSVIALETGHCNPNSFSAINASTTV